MRLAVAGPDGSSRLVDFDGMPSDADLAEVAASFGGGDAGGGAPAGTPWSSPFFGAGGAGFAPFAIAASDPGPDAGPDPAPTPGPSPGPAPTPSSSPGSGPTSAPGPDPNPSPAPGPAPSPAPVAGPSPSPAPVAGAGASSASDLDALRRQLANAERMVRGFRDRDATGVAPPGFNPKPGADQNYYLRVMAQTTDAIRKATPSGGGSLILNPKGYPASNPPRATVRDVGDPYGDPARTGGATVTDAPSVAAATLRRDQAARAQARQDLLRTIGVGGGAPVPDLSAPPTVPGSATAAPILNAIRSGDPNKVRNAAVAGSNPTPTVWNGVRWEDDPFRELPFTRQDFQASVDDPTRVVPLRTGGYVTYGQAAAAVARRTGMSSFLSSAANTMRGTRSDEAAVEGQVSASDAARAQGGPIGRAIDAMRAGDPNAARTAIMGGLANAGANQVYQGVGGVANALTGGTVGRAIDAAKDRDGNPLSQDQKGAIMALFGQLSTAAASSSLGVGGAAVGGKAMGAIGQGLGQADLGLLATQSGSQALDATLPDDQRRAALAQTVLLGLMANGHSVVGAVRGGKDAVLAGLDRIRGAATPEDAVRAAMDVYQVPRAAAENVVTNIENHDPTVAWRTGQVVSPNPDGAVMQPATGILKPELREGDYSHIVVGQTPDVSDNPTPAMRYLVRRALADPKYKQDLIVAHLDDAWRDRVFQATGVRFDNSNLVLTADNVRHAINNHSNAAIEAGHGQTTLQPGQFLQLHRIIGDFDSAVPGDKPNTVVFSKTLGKERVAITAQLGRKRSLIVLKTTYTKALPKAQSLIPEAPTAEARADTSETFPGAIQGHTTSGSSLASPDDRIDENSDEAEAGAANPARTGPTASGLGATLPGGAGPAGSNSGFPSEEATFRQSQARPYPTSFGFDPSGGPGAFPDGERAGAADPGPRGDPGKAASGLGATRSGGVGPAFGTAADTAKGADARPRTPSYATPSGPGASRGPGAVDEASLDDVLAAARRAAGGTALAPSDQAAFERAVGELRASNGRIAGLEAAQAARGAARVYARSRSGAPQTAGGIRARRAAALERLAAGWKEAVS